MSQTGAPRPHALLVQAPAYLSYSTDHGWIAAEAASSGPSGPTFVTAQRANATLRTREFEFPPSRRSTVGNKYGDQDLGNWQLAYRSTRPCM